MLYTHISELMISEDIDFIAYKIVSHWHAIGVDALVYNISQHKKEKPSGVIVICAHPITGFVISEKDFLCSNFASVQFFFIDNIYQTQKSILQTGKEVFNEGLDILLLLTNTIQNRGNRYRKDIRVTSNARPNIGHLRIFRDRRLSNKYSPIISVIDDGLNSYFPTRVWDLFWNSVMQKKGLRRSQLVQFIEFKVLRVPNRRLEIAALRCINTEYLFYFRKEGGKLVPNETVINSYRYVIEKKGEMCEKTEKTRPLAIVITQPFSEDWEVSQSSELDLIENVIDILIQTGFDIVVKPHPRESANKYDPVLNKFTSARVSLLPHKIPLESLFPSLDPDCVIGFTSTALVLAKTMYDIPAITLLDILLGRTDFEYLRVIAKDFKRLTEDICYRADSYERLKQILALVKSGDTRIIPA